MQGSTMKADVTAWMVYFKQASLVNINLLLTNHKSQTVEYWPEAVID